MKMLILGSTGMLGMALLRMAEREKIIAVGAARSGAHRSVDVIDEKSLESLIRSENPDVVVNTVAITSLDLCEKDPALAYLTNARPASIIARVCSETGIGSVHISTDHFYTGDSKKAHPEKAPVTLVNEYARTKYASECFARTYEKSLVVRTNIVGFRSTPDIPTFVEWCIGMLMGKTPAILFDDFYTSPIDVERFSEILLDLMNTGTTGILNVAGSEISSKKEFVIGLAEALNLDSSHTTTGSVHSLNGVPRADSLGLNVRKAEKILGYKMPARDDVINNLVHQYNKRS